MNTKSFIRVCLVVATVFWLAGCETTSAPKSGKTSAGVNSLTPDQSARFREALGKLDQEQPQAAEDLLVSLSRDRSEVAEIWLNLALSQYQQKKWTAAQKSLNTLLTSASPIAEVHNLAGLLAVEEGKFPEAEQHFQKAIALRPAYANALYNMALLQDIYLQNTQVAVDYYKKYLSEVKEDEATKVWVENLSQSLAK